MIIQATPYGTKKEEPFAFTYSGDFTDERVDGIGDVTLNTSGQLVTSGKTVKVTVYILGAGGGAAFSDTDDWSSSKSPRSSGGGGGNQTVTVELTPGTYDIVIGTGGSPHNSIDRHGTGNTGGTTTAFGYTSTGGSGGDTDPNTAVGGNGGTPNGGKGQYYRGSTHMALPGGTPNGGAILGQSTVAAQRGGNGLVRITFS